MNKINSLEELFEKIGENGYSIYNDKYELEEEFEINIDNLVDKWEKKTFKEYMSDWELEDSYYILFNVYDHNSSEELKRLVMENNIPLSLVEETINHNGCESLCLSNEEEVTDFLNEIKELKDQQKESMLNKISKSDYYVHKITTEMLSDEDFVIKAMRINTQIGDRLPYELKSNKDFVLKTLKEVPEILEYCDKDLFKSKDFVTKATDIAENTIEHIGKCIINEYLNENVSEYVRDVYETVSLINLYDYDSPVSWMDDLTGKEITIDDLVEKYFEEDYIGTNSEDEESKDYFIVNNVKDGIEIKEYLSVAKILRDNLFDINRYDNECLKSFINYVVKYSSGNGEYINYQTFEKEKDLNEWLQNRFYSKWNEFKTNTNENSGLNEITIDSKPSLSKQLSELSNDIEDYNNEVNKFNDSYSDNSTESNNNKNKNK